MFIIITHLVKNIFFVNQHFILQIFSFMIDVFTPKSIFPGCPFKSNQRQAKISILLYSVQFVSTAWCTLGRLSPRSDTHLRDCLCSGMHNVEIVSAAWCTLGRLSPRSDTHLRDCLCGVMHTAEIDYALCCTPQRSSPRYDAHCTPWRLSPRCV